MILPSRRLSAGRHDGAQRMDGGALGNRRMARVGRGSIRRRCPMLIIASRPLRTSRGIGWRDRREAWRRTLTAEDDRMVEALLDQTTVAIERSCSSGEATEAQAQRKASVCVPHCSPRSRMICARRSPRSSARLPACAALAEDAESGARRPARGDRGRDVPPVELRRQSPRHDAARIGRADLTARLVDLGDVVRAAAAVPEGSGRIVRSLSRSPPNCRSVQGDSGLLEQVVFNLLDNANKYADAGTPTRSAFGAEDGEVC